MLGLVGDTAIEVSVAPDPVPMLNTTKSSNAGVRSQLVQVVWKPFGVGRLVLAKKLDESAVPTA